MSDFLTDPPPLNRCHDCWNVVRCCTCRLEFKVISIQELTLGEPRVARITRIYDEWLTHYRNALYGGSREQFLERYAQHGLADLEDFLHRGL